MGISTVESYQGAQIFEAVGPTRTGRRVLLKAPRTAPRGSARRDRRRPPRAPRHRLRRRRRGRRLTATASSNTGRTGSTTSETPDRRRASSRRSARTTTSATRVRRADQRSATEPPDASGAYRVRVGSRSDPGRGRRADQDVVQRFSTAAMSLGASPEAHENNSIAMNRLGAKSNSARAANRPSGSTPSASVTSNRWRRAALSPRRTSRTPTSCRSRWHRLEARRGRPPPGSKVNEMIAHVRKSTPGVGSFATAAARHLLHRGPLQLIFDLKAANETADINVKLSSPEAGIGNVAAGVAKANADVVHISGHDGGTGVSPRTSIKSAGLPGTRPRRRGQPDALCDRPPRSHPRLDRRRDEDRRDVAVAALLGAEEYIFGTASLVTGGCVMARQCHKNTCPVGVATSARDLRKRFPASPNTSSTT